MKELIADAWVIIIFLIHMFSHFFPVRKRTKKPLNGNKSNYEGVATRHPNFQPKLNKSTNPLPVMFLSSSF